MYEGFSHVYDVVMKDIPYDQFVQLFEQAVTYAGAPCTRVMDLGCGTGVMIPHLLRRSRTVIGVDPSEHMLAIAQEKLSAYSNRVSFVQSTAARLPVQVQADLCVSFCDVFNYMVIEEELIQSFAAVARSLPENGHFLFDMHSPYKVLHVLGNQVHYDVTDKHATLMVTSVDPESLIVSYEVTLFGWVQNGLYERIDEHHEQRAYQLWEVFGGLSKAGFQSVHVGADGKLDVDCVPVDVVQFAKWTEEEQYAQVQQLEKQLSLYQAERFVFFAHR
ncbi:class I SAM-dependent DNA methyltransferase [Sulfoacidibacillus ferrooxidans]|uniref:Ubiquinone/menaquinone biosynthesis C-methyltransferase UbiE n=1 Tax=Sulfoacidibacillus ferrooxidans TaxID=2005001 RepID=A0A9X2AAJ5_9BACL|nr:Ubiquinone/menaquinone biosynthesis C-methyltransferase UbiE [Sulfoacidibacillus ferrooxidans]